jgi:hypothetical protein
MSLDDVSPITDTVDNSLHKLSMGQVLRILKIVRLLKIVKVVECAPQATHN